MLIAFTVLTLLTAYPAVLWLVGDPSFLRLLAVELWLSFLYAETEALVGELRDHVGATLGPIAKPKR
ncbi:hypothetical protein ACFW9I_32315, partial [[Kitasatospora] papulosa]|uniref:hypothetical protein n=1 Tax=[Kitasatospora] papulosa TaxID=1464011 RepID=UPI00367FF105